MSGWKVKSEGEVLKGRALIDRTKTVTKKQDFIKLYNDNNQPKIYR